MELNDLAIVDVEPVQFDASPTLRTWPCAACGDWHDIDAGFVVRHHDSGLCRTTYVCRVCAEPYLG